MTVSQIIACAIAWTAAIVAITAHVAIRYHLRMPLYGGTLTTVEPLTEEEFAALAARLEREYGKYRDGRAMPVVEIDDKERPGA